MDKLHQNIAVYTHSGSAPCVQAAKGERVIGIGFDMRGAKEKTGGAPIDIIMAKEGAPWDMEATAIVKGTKNLAAAQKLADFAVSKGAYELYGKYYAIVGYPGMNPAPPNYPPSADAAMVKIDLAKMGEERAQDPRGVDEALRRQVRAEVTSAPRTDVNATRGPRLGDREARAAFVDMTDKSDKAAAAPYLRIERLTKQFGAFCRAEGHLPRDLSGEFVCFLGPSGCGKTTLLRAIAGLDIQTSGRIFQADKEISNLPASRRDFGIVFQSYALFPNLTVAANVGYGLVSRGIPKVEIQTRVVELLRSSACPSPRASIRRSSRVASSSASPWRARWRCRPGCFCSTSRCPHSMPACARICAARSAVCTSGSASRRSWSRTTRKRR